MRDVLGGSDSDVALALACFGGGSMTAALLLPRLLDRMADRPIMLSSAGVLGGALLAFAAIASVTEATEGRWLALLPTWAILGVAYSAVMTPSSRLLRRSAPHCSPPSSPSPTPAGFSPTHWPAGSGRRPASSRRS
jgi:predicted MFS family arabinose efflux permease